MSFGQREFEARCEWAARGIQAISPGSSAIVIVDVLSFSTAVEVAVSRRARVYPFSWRDRERVDEFARSLGAIAAGPRGKAKYSLSPRSLLDLPEGSKLVLPSPNGSTLTLAVSGKPVLLGCLRNARAVAEAARRFGPTVAVIPAGERWKSDHSLRPAFEDLLGAGAVIAHLPGSRSPEAQLAADAFEAARNDLEHRLRNCASGRELIDKGYEEDVQLSAQLDVSQAVPCLQDGAFEALAPAPQQEG